MASFEYDGRILADYPSLVAGLIVARGLSNPPSPPKLRAAYLAEQAASIARIGETPLSALPSLSAWRRAFSAFGVSPTRYRSAAEALLRRLTKKGDIPSINSLVDIGNLVSIRYGLPVAVMDTRQIALPIRVHYAAGSESYTELRSAEVMHPAPGEVIFSDTTQMVVARRWCWRQSFTSAAQAATTDVVIAIEAHHAGASSDIESALVDMLTLLAAHAGGDHISAVLNSDKPAI
ncbi:MAG: phenylalanine--tRNA ligase beta subunit-related protein [Chloroflexi bacterium]|nr:phenylalanine--tRNA ligase beta subunit-related protein [Chloroflexota bacterium]MCY3582592.1 phenylalanine--tRNA ligase beta subunit-related protein [Chloroflexota bacterium]MCY3715280.1 phenylalanine--tRNA ligase beta subunit-related protein [Chloroflexota bacterium]MDE2652125.1 phenylalanine--tRNA ligase beta subunit-related protein [Chloroflexota bacterium]MXX50746.1 hypothetical protein [Chloroflexota bacterium]